ncbi:hypothetical protein [Puniceibacterium sp. IMCC21224]|uniref:hypothetical protein n=1 Tax=Puniceibacterium sp. IMCC21224 TaxID=1618204 RepID=UPI0018CC925B|nr:hypothetical protein [Puniceibacterium sp. IMCC21224]
MSVVADNHVLVATCDEVKTTSPNFINESLATDLSMDITHFAPNDAASVGRLRGKDP